ncbi:unnamed protein product [Urochloa humidicola]
MIQGTEFKYGGYSLAFLTGYHGQKAITCRGVMQQNRCLHHVKLGHLAHCPLHRDHKHCSPSSQGFRTVPFSSGMIKSSSMVLGLLAFCHGFEFEETSRSSKKTSNACHIHIT